MRVNGWGEERDDPPPPFPFPSAKGSPDVSTACPARLRSAKTSAILTRHHGGQKGEWFDCPLAPDSKY